MTEPKPPAAASAFVTGIEQRGAPLRRAQPAGRIMLTPETARVVRALARYEATTLDELVQNMIKAYVPGRHPNLELVFGEPAATNSAPAALPRRRRRRLSERRPK